MRRYSVEREARQKLINVLGIDYTEQEFTCAEDCSSCDKCTIAMDMILSLAKDESKAQTAIQFENIIEIKAVNDDFTDVFNSMMSEMNDNHKGKYVYDNVFGHIISETEITFPLSDIDTKFHKFIMQTAVGDGKISGRSLLFRDNRSTLKRQIKNEMPILNVKVPKIEKAGEIDKICTVTITEEEV